VLAIVLFNSIMDLSITGAATLPVLYNFTRNARLSFPLGTSYWIKTRIRTGEGIG
jgi:hypothetical protein